MRRRAVLAVVAAAMALPSGGRAGQSGPMRRVGVLLDGAPGPENALAALETRAFVGAMRQLGWAEGRNLAILYGTREGGRGQLRAGARTLAALAPDVILTVGGPALAELLATAGTLPIVFTMVSDPVGSGFVANLAHPGGWVTGFSIQEGAIGDKWLQLLKQIAPQITRVMVLMQADSPPQRVMRDAAAAAAPSLGVRLVSAAVRRPGDYQRVIEAFGQEPGGGLFVLPNAIATRNPREIEALAARYRLPAIYGYPIFAEAGGLISYGADPVEQFSAAARYVDRILRGAKPGDLPVQQPSRFKLVVNLKTAKALGLAVPRLLPAPADKVIE